MRFSANEMATATVYENTVHDFLNYAEKELDDAILAAAKDGRFYIRWYPDKEWLENTELPENLKIALRYTLGLDGYKVEFCHDGSVNVGWGVD